MFPDVSLEGEKVRLRKLELHDLPTVVSWFNDPWVCRALGRRPGLTLDKETAWYNEVTEDENRIVFAVEGMDGVHVGNISLYNIDKNNKHTFLSLAFGRDYWGKGYGTEATQLTVNYAFVELGLNKVSITCFPFNDRSIALFEGLGFQRDGVLRDEKLLEDGFHDMLLMSIINHK